MKKRQFKNLEVTPLGLLYKKLMETDLGLIFNGLDEAAVQLEGMDPEESALIHEELAKVRDHANRIAESQQILRDALARLEADGYGKIKVEEYPDFKLKLEMRILERSEKIYEAAKAKFGNDHPGVQRLGEVFRTYHGDSDDEAPPSAG